MTKSLIPFHSTSPLLVLAPHLLYPLRNGGDIGVAEHWGPLSHYVPYVLILGANTITRYENGRMVHQSTFENTFRDTKIAGLRTLFRRSHYLIEKFLTPIYRQLATQYLADPVFKNIVCSHLWSTSLLNFTGKDRFVVIQSHNDDFQWFQHLANHATNLPARFTALASKNWTTQFMQKHASDYWFFHCTERDQLGYAAISPNHRSFVMPVGVDIQIAHVNALPPTDKLHLIFTGSLSVTMNLDALFTFRDQFLPALKAAFKHNLEISIVGSNPTMAVQHLCDDQKWNLFANVSDAELLYLYQNATFSILPFPYATGSKLKLLKSLSFGVPFLSTTHSSPGEMPNLPFCVFSDDPEDWVTNAKEAVLRGISVDQRKVLLTYAQQFSWEALAKKMFEQLKNLPEEAT